MKRRLNYKDYFNKVYGALIGKTVIGTLGAPYEGVKMPLELEFSPEMINTMLPNDDLDLQVLWLDEVERHGLDFTPYDLQKRFAEACPYDPGEYAIMRKNYKRGVYPPSSGSFSNDFYLEGMGCPIRSEIWACLSPCDTERAVELSERDGVLDHKGESVYAEKFFVALEAEAFFESDLHKLIERALEYVPADCKFRELVSDTVALCDKYKDEKVVLRKLLFKYGHPDCTNLFENIGITLLALLLGEGDLIKTGMMALNCGFDTDCTCATAGAVLGLIMGADAIIEKHAWDDIRYILGVECERKSDKVVDLAEDIAMLGAFLSDGAIEGGPKIMYRFTPAQYPLEFNVTYKNDDPTFFPGKPCLATLSVKNHANEKIDTILSLSGIYSDNLSLSLESGGTSKFELCIPFPENEKVIADTNIVDIWYTYGFEEKAFSFGVVGAMPWKAIGPIWRTDPICNTELLIEAGLKYSKIVNAVKYDGNMYDVKRRFHLNFAPDTDTEYMSHDECFTPYDENDTATKYEESIFYQKEDSFKFSDICGLKGPAVIYLSRKLICPEDREMFLQIGHSAPFTLWINGEKMAERKCCDTFDAENVHLEKVKLFEGENKILLRITRINEDAKYSMIFSMRNTCGEHYTDLAAARPESWKE